MFHDRRRSKLVNRRWLAFIFVLIASALAIGPGILPRIGAAASPTSNDHAVTAAWEKARAAGSYHFSSDVTQVTVPVANVTNVGRTSRTEQLHLEGQTDLRRKRLEMQLWSEGGSVLQDGGVAVKVENSQTFTRRGTGEWQEADGFADALAPQGDFLAYLNAMRDIRAHAPEERAGIVLTRYSFTIDGPTFAAYVRDQTEAALRAKGELPAGVNLDTSNYYQTMTGDGELWVGENGLPLRQILNLNFPEQRDQTTHAQIVVDFSRFGTPQLSIAELWRSGDLGGLLNTLPGALPDLAPLGLLLALVTFAAIVVRYRRSRMVYGGLVTAIILSMVVGPILSILQIDGFFAAQTAKAAAQEEQQAVADATQAANTDFGQPEFNPNVNPLEMGSVGNWEIGSQSPNLAVAQSPTLLTTDTGTDTDSDGLSDFTEERVGTDVTLSDSDEDGINDALEVKGFALGGQTWYLDPRNLDSNNDGVGDGQEWDINSNSQPDDTDGDNLPDLFDNDNDNDGVPDRQDLAPFTASAAGTPFSENNPFKLTINNLTAGKATLVDLQVRPTNVKHLWFALNVLDWPQNDKAGQVQDVDGKTYADLAAAAGRTAATNEASGDLKLIPMLEIRLPANGANLPPQSELTPYNITVSNLSSDGSQKVVYVPLNIINDEQSGQRVAFGARMKYLPTGAWPTPHDVRLLWMVQTLNDLPCDPKAPNAAAEGCAADGYIHNAGQVVQSYYDDFTLTGLNVSEQHSAKTALIYEDPAIDPNLNDNFSLTALTLGFNESFLAGRDQDNNGQRDVTINNIFARFDHTQNDALTSDQRWGLDGAQNNLRVERYDYATFDQATVFTAMTNTVQLLTSQFDAHWAANNTLKPTLAYAYEQQSRSLGLDAVRTSGSSVTLNSTGVTVDMQPATLNTQVGLKWTHYCRTNSSARWTACAGDTYWNELESRHGATPLPDDPAGVEIANGSNAILQFYNLALTQGASRVVEIGAQLVPASYTVKNDNQAAGDVRNAFAMGAAGVKGIANVIVMSRYLNNPTVKAQIGEKVVKFLDGTLSRQALRGLKNLRATPGRATVLAVGVGAILTGLVFLNQAAGDNFEARVALQVLVVGVQSFFALIDPILTIMRWSREGGSVATLLRSGSEAIGVSRTANAIGAVLAISVVWGFFIYSVANNDISPNTIEFDAALAQTIAATIYIILLTILSATVIGLILVGIITVIDAILTAVCELGTDSLRGSDGACFTIGGSVVKAIASAFYDYGLLVRTDNSDLLVPGAPATQLADPNKGFVAGNDLAVTMPITNHVIQRNAYGDLGGFDHFMDKSPGDTTFKYSLTQPGPVDITNVQRGQTAWFGYHTILARPQNLRGAYARTTPPAVSGFNLQPGLNRVAPFYLNVGYALPAYSCWKIWTLKGSWPFYKKIPICGERTVTGKNSSLVDTLRYDIFPATLDAFMTAGAKPGGGQGLSWDASFGALDDLDGDGLRAHTRGGLDPDDAKIDADNDGLTDAFELDRRAAGLAFSPIQCDTDNDGLVDGQEEQFGADPLLADTDGDGLKDNDEVWHQIYNTSTCQPTGNWSGGWNVTINAATPFTVRVAADPAASDTDNDGLSDLAEYQLAQHADPAQRLDNQNRPYHPGVFNTPPVSIYTTADKRFVAPGQSLIYTTTVVANTALAPGVLDVTVPTQLGNVTPLRFPLGFDPLTFSIAQTVTNQTNLTAQAGLNTQSIVLNSTMHTRLAPTASTPLQWDVSGAQSLASTAQLVAGVRAAANANQADNFLLGINTRQSSGVPGSPGQVRVDAIPSGGSSTPFTAAPPATSVSGAPADVACNSSGLCLAVWDEQNNTAQPSQIRAALVDANGQVQQTFTVALGGNNAYDFGPVIASDGTDFVVIFEANLVNLTNGLVETRLAMSRYSSASGQFNSLPFLFATIESPRQAARNAPSVEMDLVWIGDRYRLVRKLIGATSIYATDFDRNGSTLGAATGLLNTVVATSASGVQSEGTPSLAYDPVGNRTLLVFATGNGVVRRVLWTGTNLTPTLSDGDLGLEENVPPNTIGGNTIHAWFRSPVVGYNPVANGWVINKNTLRGEPNPLLGQIDYYVSIGLMLWHTDLSGRIIPDTITATSNQPSPNAPTLPAPLLEDLACPVLQTRPTVDLRFEDLPGTTTFIDSSGLGNNATCGNCPSAGASGAVDANGIAVGGKLAGPASDYAISFNGDASQGLLIPTPVQNSFSLAFWYKSPASGNPNTSLWIDDGGQPFWSFNVFGGYIDFRLGATSFRANVNLNDGHWHFIVATRDNTTGQAAIYLDGSPTPAATLVNSNVPGQRSPLLLRSLRPASVDQFRIYPVALNGATIQALYSATTQNYCVGTQADNRGTFIPQWLKLNFQQADPLGGKITASGNLTVTIDADKPTSTISGLTNGQYILGNTIHTIGGNATDATAGAAGVEVSVNGGAFQPASGAATWAYNLSVTEGAYTLQSRATDSVGNVETPAAAITVNADGTAPNVTLNAPSATPVLPTRNGSNQWITVLSGTAVDPTSGGVASGLSATAVEVFLQGQGDAVGNGWQVATRSGNNWTLNYVFGNALPDPTGVYTVSVRAVDNVGNRMAENAATGILRLDVSGPTALFSENDLARDLITDTLVISGIVTDTGLAGLDKVELAVIPIEHIVVLPVDATQAQADALLIRNWLNTTLAQRGAGVNVTTWSLAIPAGLENEYQIDLRSTDLLGNVRITSNVWRGVIDTLAPRVTVTGTRSSTSWFDPNSGSQMFDLTFTCTATDRYLDDTSFSCPAGGATPVRTFDTGGPQAAILQALFPDRTIRNGLTVAASYWWPDPNVTITVSACDVYGHCTSYGTPLTPAATGQVAARGASVEASTLSSAESFVQAAAAGAPQAIVVAPTQGSFVAANGALNVTVAAEAGALLREVTISLDNNVVQTLAFAQSEAVTRTLRTVSLTGVGEGQHTLTARATSWDNAAQSSDFPVVFTLDAQAPTVTLDPATLTNADTWAQGSDILRFNGTANDSIGLAAVQIREGNNAFVDVEFGNGVWQTALPVTDPEGRTLNITVRAIDRAGRVSETSQTIGTDLSAVDAPNTQITATPTNPSNAVMASFAFTGTSTARNIAAFACQLDNGEFLACFSPHIYSGLSKGEHTFRVRAIDNEGNVDLSPEAFTWTINASTLDATITASPANPSNSRDAAFTFTGTGNELECTLDGAAFAACTSPQNYSGLNYGEHIFQVRARSGSDAGAAARFTWVVANSAPVANSQTVTTNENAAVAVTLIATDNDVLTYKYGNPAHGALTGVPPTLTYSPDSGYSGSDSFTFVANDKQNDSNVATVTINVTANTTDNTPPTITPQVAGTAGSNGWYLSDVSLTWSVVDGESSVTSQTGCDPATINTETAGQPFTCTATSRGGTATQSITIKLDKTAPETTLTAQPSNPSNTTSAAFQFTGPDSLSGNAGFECSLDNGAFAACPSPQNYSNLAEGSHTFRVRAVDGAGQRDTTPAEYTWTVQTLTVVATCGPITVYRNAQGQLVAPGWTGTIKLGTSGNNTIAGGSGRDLMLGLGGNDNLDGKAGDDLLCGGDGVDLVTGAAGNDVLEGGAGNDVLNGGTGDFDNLSAGDGNDVLLDGDGVINAQGGPGTDTFTIALRNGWRNQSGQPRFNGLAAGYGNDAVGLAILNTVRFVVDITGDERDNPPSPQEGNNDALVLAGLLDPTSTIIKFERRVGAARANAEGEEPVASEESISFEGFAVDPTTLTDESGAEFLTEPVGGDEPIEEVEQTEETITNLFLPLINR